MKFRRDNKKNLATSGEALKQAQKNLDAVLARDPEVHAISGALRTIRERNHFAEQLQIIMQGR